MRTVYILCGLIGSGKSTWAREKAKDEKTIIIDKDCLRQMVKGRYVYDVTIEHTLQDIAFESIKLFLQRGYDVIIDGANTGLNKSSRHDFIHHLYFKNKVKGGIKFVLVHFTETENNVDNRMNHGPRGMSREKWTDIYNNMKRVFEPPTLDELPQGGEIIEVTI